uniref:Outer membrane protein beta-barrel domain-containing protein n=1 Tax=Tenacibaculum sp. Pbs-1 TaxID=3238748 RepID=A0AB33KSX6_9FLAO
MLCINGQTQTINCELEIKKLRSAYENYNKTLEEKKQEIAETKKSITQESLDKLSTLIKDRKAYIDSLNLTYAKFTSYKNVCTNIPADSIASWFPYKEPPTRETIAKEAEQEETVEEPVTYSYFNEDVIISEDVNGVERTSREKKVFNQVLKQVNQEAYFGDITIPKEGQEFCFYNNDKERQDTLKYRFKKIDIEIRDGSLADIQVLVEYKGSMLLFENYVGVSFLRYGYWASKNYLFYSQKQPTTNVDEKEFENLRIRLSDVLMYKYKIGNNYIPHDLTLELPKEDIDGNKTNLTAPATYQIKQDTYLDKIVELRAYTDFLALFGESDNGLVQLEGSAKFYVFPFSRQIFSSSMQYEFLKSITPYVHYAKFEEDKGLVTATSGVIGNTLDLVEKRFLTVGGEVNLLEIYQKNYPMKMNFFGTIDYNLTRVQNDTQGVENLKALSYGGGISLSSKRFNNFGFNYKLGLHWFDYKSYNGSSTIDLDFKVPVVKNQAEVFYHPNKNPNQAIFARLVTYNYKGSESDEAFYQFQFGYKFSLGSRTVKK